MSYADSLYRGNSAHSFEDQLYAQLRKTPWVGASLLVHGAIFGFLLLLPSNAADDVPTAVVASIDTVQAFDELEDPPEPPPEPKNPDITKKPDDVRHIPDTEIDEKVETDDDMEDEGALGVLDQFANSPFDNLSTNRVIGVGPGAGGKFGWRKGGGRNTSGRGRGEAGGTEPAVDRALSWLARHQSPDGRWDCDGFSSMCKGNRCDGHGESPYDPGVTGLALLPFLGRGETHVQGEFRGVVKNALGYLRSIQDAEGCFGPRTSQHFQYNHSIATLAMAEAYGLSGSRMLKDPAQRAVGFVQQSQNPYLAWRYGVRDGDNDTSVTGWMVMALKSAKLAELEVDGGAFRGAIAWVDKMTEPEFGRVGYQRRGGQPARTTEMMEHFPGDQSESMTAAGVLTRIFCGQDPKQNESIQKGVQLMLKKAPRWDVDAGTIDMYYWYYGTLALHQVGGSAWKRWNEAMKTAIVDNQRTDAGRDEKGSWDPMGPWAPEGGRVYSTATMALCLQVYYRYQRVHDR
jgi:hypothetical protein